MLILNLHAVRFVKLIVKALDSLKLIFSVIIMLIAIFGDLKLLGLYFYPCLLIFI
jgi:hypothetical protein